MFTISQTPLEQINLRKELISNEAGAFSCFEGWVRNHNDGKIVSALEYEAYAPLCQKEAEKIFQEVYKKFTVIAAASFHRVGKLKVGDMAVWIGTISAHRDESFKACRYIIDEIKSRLPIWKKEYYQNGDSGWVACEACAVTRKA